MTNVTLVSPATDTKAAILRWRIEYIRVGRLLNRSMLETFAILRTRGCKVTYRETTRSLTQVTYHDLQITGTKGNINAFLDWMVQINKD